MAMTLAEIKKDPVITAFIQKADEHLGVMGYTEHGFRHAGLVSNISQNVLIRLGYPERQAELAAIAGYIHDIGNIVNRKDHGRSGAIIALNYLLEKGFDPLEAATMVGAIGNHEEECGEAVNPVSAALILADKSDVHRSRVRNSDLATFDIHDRVNYAAVHSFLNVNEEKRSITLEIKIENSICPVMEYFEIFLVRMMMCRRAAIFLGCQFKIEINGNVLL
ncbi:MAG TPA: phosphohydrolase [Firmicutes bacterium]|nr:phosphohydrolase [Bacillota bacterium]